MTDGIKSNRVQSTDARHDVNPWIYVKGGKKFLNHK